MAAKVGTLIKKARTDAGLTQEQLAKKIKGVTASDISKAERGEKELGAETLKAIAKATGVTQKSLLDAAKKPAAKKPAAASAKAPAAKKPAAAKTPSAKAGAKKASSSGSSVKLTAAEKALLELYRKADADTKKKALAVLKGGAQAASSPAASAAGTVLTSLITNALGSMKM